MKQKTIELLKNSGFTTREILQFQYMPLNEAQILTIAQITLSFTQREMKKQAKVVQDIVSK